MDPRRFETRSLTDARILRILAAALNAVDPYMAVKEHLPPLEGQVFALAIGKAAIPMMEAVVEQVPIAGGLAVTKFAPRVTSSRYVVIEGGHPIPDERSLEAGRRVLEFVSSLDENDTLVCLISGGGSALVTAPPSAVPLEDMQALTSLLLASGAHIGEINTLRRRLDRIKGGGLARATRAKVISLILSDVIGNSLEAIASGPTVPDPTTREDALQILEKYLSNLPTETQPNRDSLSSVARWLRDSKESETLEIDNSVFDRVQNIIIGDNPHAAQAARRQAEQEGFYSEVIYDALQGEARRLGRVLAFYLRTATRIKPKPFCLIAGGETTVTITGQGNGGRNQELALSAVPGLRGLDHVLLISLATDGDDGPTDAAGAVASGDSASRAQALGLDAEEYLTRNDSYPFFEALGDLLKTGPTGTNVNDLIFLFAI